MLNLYLENCIALCKYANARNSCIMAANALFLQPTAMAANALRRRMRGCAIKFCLPNDHGHKWQVRKAHLQNTFVGAWIKSHTLTHTYKERGFYHEKEYQ